MNVLSLFDGMSCGQIALERANIPVENYFASEIDKYAMAVTNQHYPNTIQLGNITDWESWYIDWSVIDLVLAGSPCQGFSTAGKGLNFDDPRSKLFFVFIDILNTIKKHNPKVKFLFENVKMKKEWENIITEFVDVAPIMIDSALVSAQSRKRVYWTNIPSVEQPKDRGIILTDIIEWGEVDREKSYCIDANYYKGGNPKSYFEDGRRQLVFKHQSHRRAMVKTIPHGYMKEKIVERTKYPSLVSQSPDTKYVIQGAARWRKLSPLECERLQTVSDDWTLVHHPKFKNRMMSNNQRYKMLGNGWTVDVIVHILKGIQHD
jgi:DNA-cytosine methyltransferase